MNKKIKLTLLVFFFGMCFASNASQITIVSQSDNWDYNFGAGLGANAGDAIFSTFTAGYVGDLNGNGPFGNSSSGVPSPSIAWNVGTALYLQTTIDLSGLMVDSALLNLAVDNGASVFVNGIKVFGATANGFTSIWEYANQTVDSTPFVNGVNTISVFANDFGGLTYFDMEMFADVSDVVEPVSAPAALLMFIFGSLFLSARRLNQVWTHSGDCYTLYSMFETRYP